MIAIPLIVILLLISCLYGYPRQLAAAQESSESNAFQGERFKAVFYLDSVYNGGYNARNELRNTSDQTIEDWTLVFSFEENIMNVWNGILKKLEDGKCQIQNAGWNQDIRAGETVTFGFSGSSTKTPNAPSDYKLVGEQCNFKLYYQSLDNALVESPKPTVSVVAEEPVVT